MAVHLIYNSFLLIMSIINGYWEQTDFFPKLISIFICFKWSLSCQTEFQVWFKTLLIFKDFLTTSWVFYKRISKLSNENLLKLLNSQWWTEFGRMSKFLVFFSGNNQRLTSAIGRSSTGNLCLLWFRRNWGSPLQYYDRIFNSFYQKTVNLWLKIHSNKKYLMHCT